MSAAEKYIGRRFNYLRPLRVVVVFSSRADAGALLECLCLRCKTNTRTVPTMHLRKSHGPRMCHTCARIRFREGGSKGGRRRAEVLRAEREVPKEVELRGLLESFTDEEEVRYLSFLGNRTALSDRLEAARMVREYKECAGCPKCRRAA